MKQASLPRELRPFVDDGGRLIQWPVKQKVQRMAADLLVAHFESDRAYTEKEVNALLCEWHTFGDWALLRRVLCDWRYLARESDGSRYRKSSEIPAGGHRAASPRIGGSA